MANLFRVAARLYSYCVQSCGNDIILFGEYGTQVEQNPSFFHPRDNRGLGMSQPPSQFLGAQPGAGDRDNSGRQNGGWRGTASNERLALNNLRGQLGRI